jgi:hypothetical protein
MRRFLLLLAVAILLLLGPAAYRYLRYYGLPGPAAASPPAFDASNIVAVATPGASDFDDQPATGNGFVLLDQAHGNEFTAAEIAFLDARLAARGYNLLPYHGDGDLETALRPASAFAVITPLEHFSRAEIRAVAGYVARGGHLLLIGDPTRFQAYISETDFGFAVNIDSDDLPLNDLANEFGIVYRGDYLYNTTPGETEGNYRNILVDRTGFAEHALTEGLETIVFYGSHSLETSAGAEPLIQAGPNTWSSQTRQAGDLVLAALGAQGRVLALGDITFLTDPYNRVYDNARFIVQVADFLVGPAREQQLADFPYFFDDPVNLVYLGGPTLGSRAFTKVGQLQAEFAAAGRVLQPGDPMEPGYDTLYVGLYSQAGELAALLAGAEVTLVIDPPLDEVDANEDTSEAVREVQSRLGNVEMAGTVLLALAKEGDEDILILLAASGEGLANGIDRLLETVSGGRAGALDDCLVQATLALCPSYVPEEPVEAELDLRGGAESRPERNEPDSGGEQAGEYIRAIEARLMGSISMGQTRQGTLAPGEGHAWTFNGGPVTASLTLETDEEIDGVLQVYDADYELVEGVDSGLAGDPETIDDLSIPGGTTYTIVVRAFFGNGGSYTLRMEGEQASEAPPVESVAASILVYSDDDGEARDDGETGAETIAALLEGLGGEWTVHTWSATDDGPLDEQTLAAYDLVIWTSGDYRSGDQFEDDSFLLTIYFATGGRLLIIGATPAFLETPDLELAEVGDLEVVDTDIPFLPGIPAGATIGLDETVEAALLSGLNIAEDEVLTAVLLRGRQSEETGEPVAVAVDNPDNEGLLFLLAVPFDVLPATAQEALLEGLVQWFELR